MGTTQGHSYTRLVTTVVGVAKDTSQTAAVVLLHVAVAPYYRWFEYYTLGPIQRIAVYNRHADKFPRLVVVLSRWRERKLSELHFTSIACTVLAAAVIGSFSWNKVQGAFWLSIACWYCSLLFSILGILLSAQQTAVLNFLGRFPIDAEPPIVENIVDRYLPLLVTGNAHSTGKEEDTQEANVSQPKWTMVFTWQCPSMFMSYSVCTFLLGLTICVITPLIHLSETGWSSDATVAVIYLIVAGISAVMFVFSAYWIYHYVQLDGLLENDEG